MDLPYRLHDGSSTDPVLTVDGATGAPGLELSHWPGNRTPVHLRHRLSTGIALRFAMLPEAERRALAEGCTAVVNNHYDTDGLCAAWTVLNPERARSLASRLIAVAAAGDFQRVPDEHAFCVDVLVQAITDPERSPLKSSLRRLESRERHQLASDYVLEHLESWLGSELDERPLAKHADLWGPALERLRADLELLDDPRTLRRELDDIDLVLFELPRGTGVDAMPGRHALFERGGRDRVLVSARQADGRDLLRLIVGTRSFFDLDPAEAPPKRFNLERVAARLRELESATSDSAWQDDGNRHASPELWFGTDEHEDYEEHNLALHPSRLDATTVLAAIDHAAD
ncbi:DUF6687 family protein [Engelhardtia mirabilis]|uniref:DUF4375 domain-containing protein n=1 Tax=Engelhardtia mirabilis TaxID=2528011 RepID=A0A518BPV8_9BACT|nr:hypothetical protein Pla133_41270 [Planctomycetes bacterium Pla133]QDV03338.1 hypothetical protein Pla86_41260 [Planctomycetes bacterium Pla86]